MPQTGQSACTSSAVGGAASAADLEAPKVKVGAVEEVQEEKPNAEVGGDSVSSRAADEDEGTKENDTAGEEEKEVEADGTPNEGAAAAAPASGWKEGIPRGWFSNVEVDGNASISSFSLSLSCPIATGAFVRMLVAGAEVTGAGRLKENALPLDKEAVGGGNSPRLTLVELESELAGAFDPVWRYREPS